MNLEKAKTLQFHSDSLACGKATFCVDGQPLRSSLRGLSEVTSLRRVPQYLNSTLYGQYTINRTLKQIQGFMSTNMYFKKRGLSRGREFSLKEGRFSQIKTFLTM